MFPAMYNTEVQEDRLRQMGIRERRVSAGEEASTEAHHEAKAKFPNNSETILVGSSQARSRGRDREFEKQPKHVANGGVQAKAAAGDDTESSGSC